MLFLSLLLSALPLLFLAEAALPRRRPGMPYRRDLDCEPSNGSSSNSTGPGAIFYLVTTTSPTALANSSQLPNVRATSFYDPTQLSSFRLRTTDPGYESTPHFSLTAGSLVAWNADAFGRGNYSYASTATAVGSPLMFVQGTGGGGGLSFGGDGGNLLLAGGNATWTLCEDDFDENVVVLGGTAEGCVATYLQAVSKPPY